MQKMWDNHLGGALALTLFSGSYSASVPDASVPLEIARRNIGGSECYFNGWLDEFRVSKGIARWTANFTPPAAPY